MHTTRGLCPVCRKVVDAKVFASGNRVFLEKYCLEHGTNTALISGDYDYYKKSHEYIKPGQMQNRYFGDSSSPCPGRCGLCEDHEQHVCMPVLEITGACDLDCPICIAAGEDTRHISLDDIKGMIDRLLESESSIDIINLSGGEPTLHPDYERIIEYLTSVERITKVSVSTNGLRLLEDRALLDFHKGKSVIVSLQLDGCAGDVYKKLRGRDLSFEKEQLIKELNTRDMDWSIIMTMARGVNDNEESVKYVHDLLIRHDNVLSLMIQPLVYTDTFNVVDRVTIPDVARLMEKVSDQGIRADDFIPLPCCNANCFSLVHLLRLEDKVYRPVKNYVRQDRYINIIKNKSFFGTDESSFNEIKDTIFSIWSEAGNEPEEKSIEREKALKSIKNIIKDVHRSNSDTVFSSRKALNTASRKIKSIYIHHFMDADTFDITRVRRCCTIYPKPDGKMYPMCTYNNLYRRKREILSDR